jgi:hypothetical protein
VTLLLTPTLGPGQCRSPQTVGTSHASTPIGTSREGCCDHRGRETLSLSLSPYHRATTADSMDLLSWDSWTTSIAATRTVHLAETLLKEITMRMFSKMERPCVPATQQTGCSRLLKWRFCGFTLCYVNGSVTEGGPGAPWRTTLPTPGPNLRQISNFSCDDPPRRVGFQWWSGTDTPSWRSTTTTHMLCPEYPTLGPGQALPTEHDGSRRHTSIGVFR